ncbi:hypothetical protein TRVL_09190 [Trypanosoma vivax]|nr:hypothetical protein TRVL_09190 [Trypanosoma vivax]
MFETSVQLGDLNFGVCSDDSSLLGRVSNAIVLELSFLIAGIVQSIILERVKPVVEMVLNDILSTSPIVVAELRDDENAHTAGSMIVLAVSTATKRTRVTRKTLHTNARSSKMISLSLHLLLV